MSSITANSKKVSKPEVTPLAFSIDLLLREMRSTDGFHLRLCAIPQVLDLEIFRTLVSGLNVDSGEQEYQAEHEYLALSRLSIFKTIVSRKSFSPDDPLSFDLHHDKLILHSEARHYLFERWLEEKNRDEFAAASARLVAYYDKQAVSEIESFESRGESYRERDLPRAGSQRAKTVRSQSLETRRMFHLIGADQEKGFLEFERLCREMRGEFRLNDCEHLISLVHQYDRVLQPPFRSRLIYHEGKLALDRHQLAHAEDLFTRIIFAFPVAPLDLQVKTWMRLGIVATERHDWREAIHSCHKALSLTDFIDDKVERRSLVYRITRDLGVVYRESGDLTQAEELLEKSIDMAKKADSLSGLAQGYNSLANLYRKLSRTAEAIAKYETSLSFLTKLDDRLRSAQVLNNIGLTYLDQRNWESSLRFFEKSLQIKREAGDTIGQATTLNNLTLAYRNLGSDKEAAEKGLLASKLFQEVGDFHDAAQVNCNLGRLYRRTSDKEEARKYYLRALELLEKTIDEERLKQQLGIASTIDRLFVSERHVQSHEMLLLKEKEAIEEELRSVSRKFWLPWWQWLAIIVFLLLLAWFLAPLVPQSLFHASPL